MLDESPHTFPPLGMRVGSQSSAEILPFDFQELARVYKSLKKKKKARFLSSISWSGVFNSDQLHSKETCLEAWTKRLQVREEGASFPVH